MSAESAVVVDLSGWGLIEKWKTTLARARRQFEKSDHVVRSGRLHTRLSSLGPIKKPVFILGCPRSGTTFLGKVMDSVPSSSYYFEPAILKYYSRLIFEGTVSRRHAARVYRSVFHSLLLAAPGNGPRIIEKNPKHTWIAETLQEIFPDAKFVFIHRDGRDVALSLAAKPWHRREAVGEGKREPGGYLYGPYPHFYIEPERHEEFVATTDYHRAIWIWRRYAEEMSRLKQTMPTEQQFHLSYEEFVNQPEAALRPLLDFMDEPASSLGVIMEVAKKGHASSVGKWKSQLTAQDRATTEKEAGATLQNLGYMDHQ